MGTVYIVDDDNDMRRAAARLCLSGGLASKTYGSARDFLDEPCIIRPACLLLDLCMPGLGGLDLQTELAKRKIELPIIFITGQGDIPSSVKAMKAGAMDYVLKPFNTRDLLTAIRGALDRDASQQVVNTERQSIQVRFDTLTAREKEVMVMVLRGFLNKQIAMELGTSEQTIKVHRGRVMQKMKVLSVAELVQAASKVGLVGKQATPSE